MSARAALEAALPALTGGRLGSLVDGAVVEERQPHLRGGAHEKLPRADIEAKFRRNCSHGGWPEAKAERFLGFARGAFGREHLDITSFRE